MVEVSNSVNHYFSDDLTDEYIYEVLDDFINNYQEDSKYKEDREVDNEIMKFHASMIDVIQSDNKNFLLSDENFASKIVGEIIPTLFEYSTKMIPKNDYHPIIDKMLSEKIACNVFDLFESETFDKLTEKLNDVFDFVEMIYQIIKILQGLNIKINKLLIWYLYLIILLDCVVSIHNKVNAFFKLSGMNFCAYQNMSKRLDEYSQELKNSKEFNVLIELNNLINKMNIIN